MFGTDRLPELANTGRPSASRDAAATTPTSSPTPTDYEVGDTLTGGQFAAALMDRMGDKSVRVTTTSGGERVRCVVTAAATGDFSMRNPAGGIFEMRVLRDAAYLEDQPGKPKPWLAVDLSSGQYTVPTQAIADALNKINEVRAGDCRWNERLAAIDPNGVAKVTAASADGWTFSVPTDPESQRDKNSDSKRTYPLGTWRVTKAGMPISYRASNSERTTVWSKWSEMRISAPPADQVRR